MRWLIAPDSFKGTYTARQVATAVAQGLDGEIDVCPLADGGEGTMEIIVEAKAGLKTEVPVHDPLGRPITAPLGWIDDRRTAVVETAVASGLSLLAVRDRDAEAASTNGVGELIVAAKVAGARRIVVAAGGSASTDGGAGAIHAIEAGGGLEGIELIVLCDVMTPFERAAELFAAQKGADPSAVRRLSARLDAYAADLPRDPRGRPMTGAAGGLSGGLWATHGANLQPGASWILDAIGFDRRVARADAVITGEGRLDRQTLEGKLVGEVAARCRRAGKPLYFVAGSSELDRSQTEALGVVSTEIATDRPGMEAAGAALASLVAARGTKGSWPPGALLSLARHTGPRRGDRSQ